MRHAVVTGAAGFIGRHLVDELIARDCRVIAVDRLPMPWPGAVCADLLEHSAPLDDALASADAVFHLAGCSGVRTDPAVATWHRDNVLATEALLARVPLSTPLVVTSSSSVYGGCRESGRALREADVLRPLGAYAATKTQAERLCRERIAAGGVVAVARPFTVAGEGQRDDMALARWIAAAAEGRALRVIGSVARTRDVTDVRDVARALVLLAEARACGPVNVGTGVAHGLSEMIDAVCEAVGRPAPVEVVRAAVREPDHTLADVSRLVSITGFRPVTDLPALVRRQAVAYDAGRAERGPHPVAFPSALP